MAEDESFDIYGDEQFDTSTLESARHDDVYSEILGNDLIESKPSEVPNPPKPSSPSEESEHTKEPIESYQSHASSAHAYTHNNGEKYSSKQPSNMSTVHLKGVTSTATSAIYVGELSWWTTEDDLRTHLSSKSLEKNIREITFFEHKVNGKSRGIAYVLFNDIESSKEAKEIFQSAQFSDKACVVYFAPPSSNPFRTLPKEPAARRASQAASQNRRTGQTPQNYPNNPMNTMYNMSYTNYGNRNAYPNANYEMYNHWASMMARGGGGMTRNMGGRGHGSSHSSQAEDPANYGNYPTPHINPAFFDEQAERSHGTKRRSDNEDTDHSHQRSRTSKGR